MCVTNAVRDHLIFLIPLALATACSHDLTRASRDGPGREAAAGKDAARERPGADLASDSAAVDSVVGDTGVPETVAGQELLPVTG